jgi:hypothetical protein
MTIIIVVVVVVINSNFVVRYYFFIISLLFVIWLVGWLVVAVSIFFHLIAHSSQPRKLE